MSRRHDELQYDLPQAGEPDNVVICNKRSQVIDVMRRYGPLVNYTVGGLLVGRHSDTLREHVRRKHLLLVMVGKGTYVPLRQLQRMYRSMNRKKGQTRKVSYRWDELDALDL